MICLSKNEQGAELLAGYLARTLDAPRMAQLEGHIRECADCRGLASVWERLDEFAAPEVSPGFDARLYARIAREEARLSWTLTWKRWLWPPVAPLAAVTAVMALMMLLRVPAPGPMSPDASKQAVSTAEIEQVAQAVDDLYLLTPIE